MYLEIKSAIHSLKSFWVRPAPWAATTDSHLELAFPWRRRSQYSKRRAPVLRSKRPATQVFSNSFLMCRRSLGSVSSFRPGTEAYRRWSLTWLFSVTLSKVSFSFETNPIGGFMLTWGGILTSICKQRQAYITLMVLISFAYLIIHMVKINNKTRW